MEHCTKLGYKSDLPQSKQKSSKALLLKLPLLYFALLQKTSDLELIKLLIKSNPDLMKPIQCTKGLKYKKGSVTIRNGKFEIDFLTEAIECNQNVEVIKIINLEMKGKIKTETYVNAFKLAIMKEDLEVCKHFSKEMDDTEFETYNIILFYRVFKMQNIPILECLISKKKGKFGFDQRSNFASPLHAILLTCEQHKYKEQKTHKCVKMTQLILPKFQNINAQNEDGETILNKFVTNWSYVPCALEITKLIAPLCETTNYINILHLACAIKDVELLRKLVDKFEDKNIFLSDHVRYPTLIENAIRCGSVNVVEYLISKNASGKWVPYPKILYNIVKYCTNGYYDSSKIHQCIEMAELFLPTILKDINTPNRWGFTLLDTIIRNHNYLLETKCTFDVVKLIAPLCEIKEEMKNYPSPIFEILEPFYKRKFHDQIKTVPHKKARTR